MKPVPTLRRTSPSSASRRRMPRPPSRRRERGRERVAEAHAEAAKTAAPRKAAQAARRAQHRRLELAAAVVVNNGRPKLVKAARHTLPSGRRRRRRGARPRGARQRDRRLLPTHRPAAQERPARHRQQPHRRPRVRAPRRRRPAAARERDPLPRPRGAPDPDRGGDARLPRHRGHGTAPSASCSPSHTATSSIASRPRAPRRRSSSPASTSRRSRLLRALGGGRFPAGERAEAARVAVSIGHDRTTVAVSDGRRLRVHASARLGRRPRRQPRSSAPSRLTLTRPSGSSGSLDVSSKASDEPGDEHTTRARRGARREVEQLARELASSLHFYQDQPDSLGFAEITITGGGAHLQGLAAAARGADRRQRPCRRPVRTRRLGTRHQLRWPGRLARRRNRTGNRGLMRAVNLLPRQQVEQKRERPSCVALVAADRRRRRPARARRQASCSRTGASTASARRSPTRGPCSPRPPRQESSAKTQAFRATSLSQREHRALALAAALGKRVAWDRVLRRVALVLPGRRVAHRA